jgi:TATA-box binding protein (TBP) (component of TFIID and TFIIIB)
VRNGVWKATFGVGPPMYEARCKLYGDYCRTGFQAVGCRCIDKQNTISMMGTGGVNVTAALTRYDALITIWTTAILLYEHFDLPIDISNVGVVNMTASAGLGVKVDLRELEKKLNETSIEDKAEACYDPEYFPNLVYKDEEHKLAFGVSSRGFVNVVGAKNEAHMDYVVRVLFPRVKRAVEYVTLKSNSDDVPVAEPESRGRKRKRARDEESEDDDDDDDDDQTEGDAIYLKDKA